MSHSPGVKICSSRGFTVDSMGDTVARLREHGGELIGEVVQYENQYRLFYMRGPAGIIDRRHASSPACAGDSLGALCEKGSLVGHAPRFPGLIRRAHRQKS